MSAELHTSSETARAAVANVLRSRNFIGAERRKKLLQYLVDETLAGRGESLKEFNIGVEVYGRDPSTYDPRLNPMVRVDVGRLRTKLNEYYATEGRNDSVRVQLPKGSYAVTFHNQATAVSTSPLTGPPELIPVLAPKAPKQLRFGIRFLIATAIVLLSAATYLAYRRWSNAQLRSVVVLPFVNLTGDPNKEYLTDGITEQLTDALSNTSDLRVVARTSAFQFKRKAVDIREIGRKVDADAVVEGSLRNSNGRFQLTVQVNRSRDGYHIFSRIFEGDSKDLERLENELTVPVLAAIRPRVTIAARKSVDPEAYDLFLKARAVRGLGSVAASQEALADLNLAIQRDPTFADAYAALAGVYASASVNFATEPLAYAQDAKAAAATALKLNPSSAQAYAAEGMVDSMVLLNWNAGESEFRKAIRLMPQNATAHNWMGVMLVAEGRFEPALAELRTAQRLDPLPAAPAATIGMAYYMGRQYDLALHQFLGVHDLHPDVIAVHPWLGAAYEAQGLFDKSLAEYQIAQKKIPAEVNPQIAHLLAVTGRENEARKMLAAIERSEPGQTPNPFDIAIVYTGLGDRDKAFQWLDRAYDARLIWFLKVHPLLDPLRHDPRFLALLKKTGLT